MVVAFTLGFAIPGRSALASGAEASGGGEKESTKFPQNVAAFLDHYFQAALEPQVIHGNLHIKRLIYLKDNDDGSVDIDNQEDGSAIPHPSLATGSACTCARRRYPNFSFGSSF
eukprot:GHVT01024214.1.p1 GENE.GHVT01024214.1~~GHVT01024214.1.p1  ORF type:complete len:126 (-),score=15.27 GHVT01024214.1:455-796(-)